jgi:hypothetical protein
MVFRRSLIDKTTASSFRLSQNLDAPGHGAVRLLTPAQDAPVFAVAEKTTEAILIDLGSKVSVSVAAS